ncbi:cytochrome P450 [Sediminicoccus sp. KRV36]|uniref:cytochrome P450 n=1 Tax=Sediminicoccus sp. KRV36 TaxID=3133721 RepID=UPI00201042DD|nr:cytochrome P450 [Sediminicoccus rosea]UPY37515.1 cytochrome P450 [Sediminicoccus rosea]
MTAPTPPHPPRHKGQIPVTELLAKASRSLLEVWGEEMFRNQGTVLEVLGQRLMVFNRPEAVEAVLVTQAEIFAGKPPQLRKLLGPLMEDGLFLAEGAVWRARRPATAGATGPAHFEAAIQAWAQRWAADWGGLPDGASVEVIGVMEQCAAEWLCHALFGAQEDRAAVRDIARLAAAYRAKITGGGLVTMLALPEALARLRMRGEARRIHAAVDPLIARARAVGGSIVAHLATQPGMPAEALRQEVISLFAMGHDALAGLLASAWFLLAEAPAAEAALHAELAQALAGAAPQAADLQRLPMLRAVLMEALRLYPPVPLLGRVAARATEVAGVPVPRGSLACIAPWVLHRHRARWEAPDEFRPERFLPGAPAPAPFTYLPFGHGPRHCVGEAMTLHASMILLATLAQRFRLRALPGHRPAPRAGLTLSLAARLPMRLERRALPP